MQNEKEQFITRTIQFSIGVLGLCKLLREQPIFWPIADQLIRSATSIGANIAEAKGSSSRRDYINFFQIALKSSHETKYWLVFVQAASPLLKTRAADLHREAEEISKIIGSSVITLKSKNKFSSSF